MVPEAMIPRYITEGLALNKERPYGQKEISLIMSPLFINHSRATLADPSIRQVRSGYNERFLLDEATDKIRRYINLDEAAHDVMHVSALFVTCT